MDLFLFFLLVIVIIITSAVLSGTEAAIFSVSYTKIKEKISSTKNKKKLLKAKNLLIIKENLQEYITTIVILNNFINIVGSIYIGVIASSIFGEIYLGVVSAILTFLIIMFAEIIPKIYGELHNEKISLNVANTLFILNRVFRPFSLIFNNFAKLLLRLPDERPNKVVSEGEIREMAILGSNEGSINEYESQIINNVFKMNDIEAYEIMVPKNRVVTLNLNSKFKQVIDTIKKSGNTRFPVENENGEIVGIINAKDLFKYYNKIDSFLISKILRPVEFAPEAMKIFTLEEKLKKTRNHMAIVVNEYGDFTGIVTLEDIIEEVLGDIEDEFDKEQEQEIKEVSDNKYQIKGETDIESINETLGISLPVNLDFNSLNGFLIYKLDKIPKVNDKVKTEFGTFRVISSTNRKVLRVEFLKNKNFKLEI